ncbi:MAG: T9SS type A sorting domain-containing protein [Bacteroidetes bacterium]|nr:T9SS type A sorting domain-containing protein [Bacteroidota bacterium]
MGVGIEESEEINLAIAPNPVTDYGTLSFPVQNHEGQLEIINALGEIVIQSKIAPWSQFKKIGMENLPSGLYFCRIKWKEKQAVVKVIKSE